MIVVDIDEKRSDSCCDSEQKMDLSKNDRNVCKREFWQKPN